MKMTYTMRTPLTRNDPIRMNKESLVEVKNFNEFVRDCSKKDLYDLIEQFLTEMPHIMAGNQAIDLELERNRDLPADEFIAHIKKFVNGEAVKAKASTMVFQVKPENKYKFIQALLNNYSLKAFVHNKYGPLVWLKIVNELS